MQWDRVLRLLLIESIMSKLCYTVKHNEFTIQVKAATYKYDCGVIIEVKSIKSGKSYVGLTKIPCFTGNSRKVRRLARLVKRKLIARLG